MTSAGLRLAAIPVVFAMAAACGCESRPQAPVLRDSPIYQNDTEGIRFLVPDGWTQTASATLPEGHFDDEMFLVRYTVPTADSGAMMVLLVLSEQAPIDMTAHLTGPSLGVETWTPATPLETLEVNGVRLEHHELTAGVGPNARTKEAYVFRSRGRVYSFMGLYASTDAYARQQIERAVKTLEVH